MYQKRFLMIKVYAFLKGAHDGYVKSHGLTHVRKLKLAQDGQTFEGEDLIIAIEDSHKRQFDKISKKDQQRLTVSESSIPFASRCHIALGSKKSFYKSGS